MISITQTLIINFYNYNTAEYEYYLTYLKVIQNFSTSFIFTVDDINRKLIL